MAAECAMRKMIDWGGRGNAGPGEETAGARRGVCERVCGLSSRRSRLPPRGRRGPQSPRGKRCWSGRLPSATTAPFGRCICLGRQAIEDKKWDDAHAWFAKTREAGGARALPTRWGSWPVLADGMRMRTSRRSTIPRRGSCISPSSPAAISARVNSLRVVMEEVFKEGADLAPLVRDPDLSAPRHRRARSVE